MPPSWLHMKADLRNILAIHKKFGTIRLKTFPTMSIWKLAYYQYVRGIRSVSILNYIPYRKSSAMMEMTEKLGWQYYGGKHYESTFTKFYQAYLLPTKFNVDKRRCHLSNLILNSEVSRDAALVTITEPLYAPGDLETDREYVLKKLGFTCQELDEYLRAPAVPHSVYPSDEALAKFLITVSKRLRLS
jgi:hypothetical protein